MGRYDDLLQAEEKPKHKEPSPVSVRPTPAISTPQQLDHPIPERANARTIARPNGKRIITRNSFEIYEDQMDDLRELAFQEKRQGKLGSMSAMVRDAIDHYLTRAKKS